MRYRSFENITVEDAKKKYRHIELNGPTEETNGIQITLFDDEASVTVPFWHQGAAARRVFEEIWSYVEIIEREGGFLRTIRRSSACSTCEKILSYPSVVTIASAARSPSSSKSSKTNHGGSSGTEERPTLQNTMVQPGFDACAFV